VKLRVFTYVLAVVMILGLAVYGIYWNVQANKKSDDSGVAYSRAFNELLENLDDTENYLLKAMASGSAENSSLMLSEVWRSASLAESHLEILPISQNVMSDVSKYIVQLADVSRNFCERNVYGDEMSKEDAELLSKMYGYAQDVNGAFQYMAASVASGKSEWSDVQTYSETLLENDEIAEGYEFLRNFSEPMEDYPTLIYDGPFSEHMTNGKPKSLDGEEITKEQGAEIARKMLPDYNIKDCTFAYENSGTGVKTYSYVLTIENSVKGGDELTGYIDITVQGGKLYSFIMYRGVEQTNLTADQAVKQGEDYLEAIGFDDMEPSYYTIDGGSVTANYCYEEDDVLCYPDMVKVIVTLDTGDIIGVEAERYIMNHHGREIAEPELNEEEAAELLSEELTVQKIRRCIIPNDFGGEYTTYEFSCLLDGRNCLVYIDCKNGRERDILIMYEDESGILVK